MTWHGRRVTVYAYARPTDMRKGFDGLCALISQELLSDPLSGDVYLFVSRTRVRAKVLHWDGTGLCVYAKRLERGRFAALWRDGADGPVTLTVSELQLFLEGSTLVGRVPLSPPALVVDSQTLWDQLQAIARHLEPTYEALGRCALEAPVINVDETRWAIMGAAKPAAGTVWSVRAPTVAFYRILPGKSADDGRQILGGYRGTVVVDGFAVYEVLARDGPGFALAHCWAHTKRKYDDIAPQWPATCAEIGTLIGELYAVERLVPGPFPGDPAAQALRHQLRDERSRPVIERIRQWATVQVGLPRSDFGKAVRYMLERWTGLTRFLADPRVPLDNNAAERALRGPVVGRKNHYGSRSLRGTQVAALFYTLCETAKLLGVDPHAYLLRALYTAIARPGAVTLPEDLLTPA